MLASDKSLCSKYVTIVTSFCNNSSKLKCEIKLTIFISYNTVKINEGFVFRNMFHFVFQNGYATCNFIKATLRVLQIPWNCFLSIEDPILQHKKTTKYLLKQMFQKIFLWNIFSLLVKLYLQITYTFVGRDLFKFI